MSWLQDLYPIVIMQTRYGGTYEGGTWAAFCCGEDEEAEVMGAFSDDTTCSCWWAENFRKVGVAETPDRALENLIRQRWTG